MAPSPDQRRAPTPEPPPHADTTWRLGVNVNWHAHVDQPDRTNIAQVMLAEAKLLRDAGFDDVELVIAHCEPFLDELGLSFWREMGAALRELGLEPISVHGPYFPTLDADLPAAITRLARHARASAAVGARAMVVHPTFHSHLHVTDIARQALTRDTEVALRLSDALADSPTALAIENVPANSFRYLTELLGRLDRPNLGLCFDTGHYQVRPEHTLASVLERFAGRIVHLHLSDNDGLTDQHLPPGAGTFDWSQLWRCTGAPVFAGHVMLELSTPMRLQQGDSALAEHRRLVTAANLQARQTLHAAGFPLLVDQR